MTTKIETPFDNEHAQDVAALLRYTVCNPSAPTLDIDYTAWQRINSVLWSKPYRITDRKAELLIQDFCALTASISETCKLAITADDLTWLLTAINNRETTTITLLMAMAVMQPIDDMISLEEVAQIIGHSGTSNLRGWIAEGRFLSAKKPGGRDWLIAKSEIKLKYDV